MWRFGTRIQIQPECMKMAFFVVVFFFFLQLCPGSFIYGKFNDTPIWNKQRGKTFKYVFIRSAKELLNHIPLAVNSQVKIIIHLSVIDECPVVFLYIFWL